MAAVCFLYCNLPAHLGHFHKDFASSRPGAGGAGVGRDRRREKVCSRYLVGTMGEREAVNEVLAKTHTHTQQAEEGGRLHNLWKLSQTGQRLRNGTFIAEGHY